MLKIVKVFEIVIYSINPSFFNRFIFVLYSNSKRSSPSSYANAMSERLGSSRQTFPSGLTPAVKDCFGLYGHHTFGSVANKRSGVGRFAPCRTLSLRITWRLVFFEIWWFYYSENCRFSFFWNLRKQSYCLHPFTSLWHNCSLFGGNIHADSVEALFPRNSLTNFCAFASKLIWRMSGVLILSDQSLNSFSISSIEGRVFL